MGNFASEYPCEAKGTFYFAKFLVIVFIPKQINHLVL